MKAGIDDRQSRHEQSISLGRRPDVEYWTAKRAAKTFGVSIELLSGLVKNKSLPGYVDAGRTGQPVAMIDVAALKTLLNA